MNADLALAEPRYDAQGPVGETAGPGHDDTPDSGRRSAMAGLFVASVLSLFIFALMNWPDVKTWADYGQPLLFLDTTPSGGDMGAHVWGPAFLRDYLLPELRLAGWTPDWYAGFPAFHYYMVVPALGIVLLNVGLTPIIGYPLGLAVMIGAVIVSRRLQWGRYWFLAGALLVALGLMPVPYGVAFKLVSVLGLVFFPLAAWGMGRLARASEPIPAFLAIAAFFFLFDTNFNIYGGNIASTLAGEFAFSISICLFLLAIGFVFRGMDDNKWRAGTAAILALVALTHLLPVFLLIPAVGVATLTAKAIPRLWPLALTISLAIVPMAFAEGRGLRAQLLAAAAVAVIVIACSVAESTAWARVRWMLVVGPVSILLVAFWLLPFYLREPYFNDMGWERLNEVGAPMLTVPMEVALPVAALGLLLSYGLKERLGMVFGATGAVFASAVANLGEGALWNARLLPFYYLSVYFLAAIGIALGVRYIALEASRSLSRPNENILAGTAAVALVAALIAVAMPLRSMPGGQVQADGTYRWFFLTNTARSFLPTWIDWNYSGYELKNSYREYAGVVSGMQEVCDTHGPGRAMWEYEKSLDRYGTPMALMLLPHWTDGCIGSMEGLYFESSATTPFHFLNQSMMSESPSRAQRDLPYLSFDIDAGVQQLQLMGVRYYLAQTDSSIQAARDHAELTEIGEAQPYVFFEVAGADLVEPLTVEPVVVAGLSEEQAGEAARRFDIGWVSQAVEQFNNPAIYPALPAESGPSDWASEQLLSSADGVSIEPATVTDVNVETNSVSFRVYELGKPILVKVSYFPNWEVKGATGPWRVGPNLMAVVPTANEVTLSYGRTPVDWLAHLLTLLGLACLVGLALAGRRRSPAAESPAGVARGRMRARGRSSVGGGIDPDQVQPRWSPGHDTDLGAQPAVAAQTHTVNPPPRPVVSEEDFDFSAQPAFEEGAAVKVTEWADGVATETTVPADDLTADELGRLPLELTSEELSGQPEELSGQPDESVVALPPEAYGPGSDDDTVSEVEFGRSIGKSASTDQAKGDNLAP